MEYTFDLQRIFFGEAPPIFLLEILFRTLVLFLYTLALLRFLGNRGLGQLSMGEFALIIALGSAVGDPMFYPDVPLAHGMAVVTVIVVFSRFMNRLTERSRRMANVIEGKTHRVVIDGEIDLVGMREAHLGPHEIYAEIRQAGYETLGQVRRAYLEIDGEMSVFAFDKADQKPGLSLIDAAVPGDLDPNAENAQYRACIHCGYTDTLASTWEAETASPCPRCKYKAWGRGVLIRHTANPEV